MKKRKGRIFFLVLVFSLNAGFLTGLPQIQGEGPQKAEELQRVIRVLNLVNGLDLTGEQMETILHNAEESERLKEQFRVILFSRQGEMEGLLEEIESHVKENREVPPAVAQRYHRLNKEIKEARYEMAEGIKNLANGIEEKLESHQIYQLEKFIPCIIPPEGEKRIGQASNLRGLARRLERIRGIPHTVYRRRKEAIVERTLENMKFHAPPASEFSEEEMKGHIQTVYDEIRNLEEAEFEIQKENLAERLVSPFKPQNKPKSLTRRIQGFLLSPEIIPILKERVLKAKLN